MRRAPVVPSAVQARNKAKVPSAKSSLSCLVTDVTGEWNENVGVWKDGIIIDACLCPASLWDSDTAGAQIMRDFLQSLGHCQVWSVIYAEWPNAGINFCEARLFMAPCRSYSGYWISVLLVIDTLSARIQYHLRWHYWDCFHIVSPGS